MKVKENIKVDLAFMSMFFCVSVSGMSRLIYQLNIGEIVSAVEIFITVSITSFSTMCFAYVFFFIVNSYIEGKYDE